MITDFWTKTGSHYRRDDVANTVECIGPEPFPPHKVLATGAYSPPTMGRRFVAVWATVGPTGKGVMHTSTVVRVVRSKPLQERRAAFARCRAGKASDADRVALATVSRDGSTMLGPVELQRCTKHRRNFEAWRWIWSVPENGDHLLAIQNSDGEAVRQCPRCAEEDEP